MTKIIIFLISVSGLILFGLGLLRLWQRKWLRGGLHSMAGLLLVAAAIISWSVALNLYTYKRLTHETAIAQLRFEARGPQAYRGYVMWADQHSEVFELRGDEWQLDARVLKWTGPAVLMGLDTGYQLDRITGRYRDLQQQRQLPHTVYSLYQERGLDIWSLAREHRRWLPWMDAIYGSATYMPMADRAEFSVTLTTSGLISRPENAAARQAVAQWR